MNDERYFQRELKKELRIIFPGCIVIKLDCNDIPGIPDLLILYKDKWAVLECKKSEDATHRPNQDYYVELLNDMSFSRFIYPENKEEVLYELQRSFETRRYFMNFNDHSRLAGKHAFLSASKYHWLNYDDEKLENVYSNALAAQKGTELHELASKCLELHRRLPKEKETLCMFVNDSLSYNMKPEVTLYFSENCFGTADAISFEDGLLRIHDYKSGTTPAHMEQLKIYAALFCLEYMYKPKDISMELRIYQNNEIDIECPEPEEIDDIIKTIKRFDRIISEMKEEE